MSEKLWFSFHTSYTSVLVASYLQQKSVICLIALRCLRAYNVFGQHHPAPVTLATKATPRAAYTGRVPSRMPHACPRSTKKWKQWNILLSKDTQDTLLLHKASTKAHASSMPVHSQCCVIINKTLHLSVVTHEAKATTQETHCWCTRHVPRRVPRPCPLTTSVMKSRTKQYIS